MSRNRWQVSLDSRYEGAYLDCRIGGEPRYYFPPRADAGMRVPDEVLRCIVFIGREHGIATKYVGTGFVVMFDEKVDEPLGTFRFPYLVTANHVADLVDGAPFKIRTNKKSTGEAVEIEANESGDLKWYRHSKGAAVDVAVCPFPIRSSEFEIMGFNTTGFFSKEIARRDRIGVGDEVLITGLFGKVKGKSRNIPIVRIGNLAMTPNEPIVPTKFGNIEAYIIEAKSLGGISGSPVFIRRTVDIVNAFHKWGTNETETIQAATETLYLLGLVHGHWSIDPEDINDPNAEHSEDGINQGLAIVVPAAHILEVINCQELKAMRETTKEKELVKHRGSTMDSAPSSFTKHDFEEALKKVSRKADTKEK